MIGAGVCTELSPTVTSNNINVLTCSGETMATTEEDFQCTDANEQCLPPNVSPPSVSQPSGSSVEAGCSSTLSMSDLAARVNRPIPGIVPPVGVSGDELKKKMNFGDCDGEWLQASQSGHIQRY